VTPTATTQLHNTLLGVEHVGVELDVVTAGIVHEAVPVNDDAVVNKVIRALTFMCLSNPRITFPPSSNVIATSRTPFSRPGLNGPSVSMLW
jgi:hypothetical protein